MLEHQLLGCVPPVCWIRAGRLAEERKGAGVPRTHARTLYCTRILVVFLKYSSCNVFPILVLAVWKLK